MLVVYSLLLEVKMQLFKKQRGREAERQRGREVQLFKRTSVAKLAFQKAERHRGGLLEF